MNICEYFTLEELTITEQPFDNTPELWQIVNLTRLGCMVLDPLRRMAGPLHATSGFRSIKVNEAVGGALRSFHTKGLAVDLFSRKHSPRGLMAMLGALEYDKAIIYDDMEILHIQVAAIGALPRGEKYERIKGKYKLLN